MLFDDAVLLITTGILTMVALVASYFIVLEVLRIVRDMATSRAQQSEADADLAGGPIRQITPFRDRETVERLIDHFEDEEETPG